MKSVTLNIERREKVPEWQKRAWREFLEMLDERAAAQLKEGEKDELAVD